MIKVVLRSVQIAYRQSVAGVVEDVRMEGSQRLLKVGGQWYHGEKPGAEVFSDAPKGSAVRLVSFGCTANENACIAVPESATKALSRALPCSTNETKAITLKIPPPMGLP